jgi:hypothetical protein
VAAIWGSGEKFTGVRLPSSFELMIGSLTGGPLYLPLALSYEKHLSAALPKLIILPALHDPLANIIIR